MVSKAPCSICGQIVGDETNSFHVGGKRHTAALAETGGSPERSAAKAKFNTSGKCPSCGRQFPGRTPTTCGRCGAAQ
jgi:hypothetical protein